MTGLYTILLPVLAFGLLRFVAASRGRWRLGDGGDHVRRHRGLGIAGVQPGRPQWLASRASARCLRRPAAPRPLARLGFLADFISRTVLVGFLTGVGIQVAMGQVAGMLGVLPDVAPEAGSSGTVIKFLDTLRRSARRRPRPCRLASP